MPEMNGWDVIEAIRRRAPTMPIILITAFNSPEVVQRASQWRVPVVPKPFPMAVLKAAVGRRFIASLPHLRKLVADGEPSIGATSRPHVQQASVGRRRPWASSQMGGVTG